MPDVKNTLPQLLEISEVLIEAGKDYIKKIGEKEKHAKGTLDDLLDDFSTIIRTLQKNQFLTKNVAEQNQIYYVLIDLLAIKGELDVYKALAQPKGPKHRR